MAFDGFGALSGGAGVSLAVAAVFAVVYLPMAAGAAGPFRSLSKTLSVAFLALAAALGGAPWLLVLALGLCAAGDFCLSEESETSFMAGVGAFAAGHLAYVALFLSIGESDPTRLISGAGPAFVAGFAVVGLFMAWLLAPRAGDLKVAVLAYVPIILAMGVAALTLPPVAGLALVLPAALAFMASDITLAFETFVLAEDHPARRATPYAVWPLYWGAQAAFLLAFS